MPFAQEREAYDNLPLAKTTSQDSSSACVTSLMNAEQAILIIDGAEWDFDGRQNYFRYSVANSGKTAATIFAANGSLQIGDTRELPPDVSVFDCQPAHVTIETIISPNSKKKSDGEALSAAQCKYD
jgi:hypothetical protein